MRIDMKNKPDEIIYESDSCDKKIDDITIYFNKDINKVKIWFSTIGEEFTMLEMESDRAKKLAADLIVVAEGLEDVYKMMKENPYGSD